MCVCLAGSGDQVSGGRLKLWSPWLGWPGVDVNAKASVVGGSDSLGLSVCVCLCQIVGSSAQATKFNYIFSHNY